MSVVAVGGLRDTVLSGSDCTVSGDDLGSMCGVVWCCDQDGCTALLLACENGHLDVARWLVTDAGSNARSEQDNVSYCCLCVCNWAFSL
jgi:hypothetical protein